MVADVWLTSKSEIARDIGRLSLPFYGDLLVVVVAVIPPFAAFRELLCMRDKTSSVRFTLA